MNRFKDIKDNYKKLNIKGFTLIELLGVVAIIAVLLTIAIVGVNSYMRSTKEKANEISIESIKKSAVVYANENYTNESYWVKSEVEDLEYSCVPILELVNKGYLKKEDIENHNDNWEFVKVNRYFSNKTIFSEENGDDVCSWGTSGDKSTTLVIKKITTSSVEVQTTCDPSEGVSGFSFALKTGNYGEEIRNNNYKFSNLVSGNKYQIKSRCNYTDGVDAGEAVSENIEVGSTDVSFSLADIKTDDKMYKNVTVKFSSSNVTYPSYYFKTSSSDNVSNTTVMICGNGNTPSNCTDYSGTLQKGYWYKLKEGNEVVLSIYSSSVVYAKVWDGERYSTNKSIQVTFPTNPYVVVDVSHNNYDTINNAYSGENTETLKYNVGKWLSNPAITWKVYGGYETKSYVYYSNNNESQTTRNNYNSSYKFTISNSDISTDSYGGELKNIKVSGLQEIGIVVENIRTKKQTIVKVWVDLDPTAPTVSDIGGGTTLKATSQSLTLKCSDTIGVTAYYWGTTEPTAASSITTTTSADLTSLKGSSGLSKTVSKEGTYWLGCKDAAGNYNKKSIVIRKYVVNNLLETIAGTTGTYKSSNYTSASTGTYYIKNGTTLTLTSIYTIPTGAASGTFKGYSTSYSGAAVTPSTTNPTVATNDTTTYYMWFNRNTYTVTVSKPTNGTVKAETVTRTGNSVTASSTSKELTVKYGDTVKATASSSTGYSFSSWSGGYVSGTTNPSTGAIVTASKTITASFTANPLTFNAQTLTAGTYNTAYNQSFAAASNGTGTYTYTITKVTLGGSALTASSGKYNGLGISGTTISGTPTKAGTYVFTIKATDSKSGVTKEANITIVINKKTVGTPTNLAVSTAGVVTFTKGANSTGHQISIDGKNWATFTSGSSYLSTINASTGSRTVYVRAVNSDTTNYTTPSSNATKAVTVYKVTIQSNSTTMGTVDTSSYNVISGATYTTSSNVLTIKGGSTTLKTITATAKTGYNFSKWSSTSGSITSATTITATFADTTAPTLTITLSGVVSASITKTGGTNTIQYNGGNWSNVIPTVSWSVNDTGTTSLTGYYNSASNYSSMSAYSTSNINVATTTSKSGSFTIGSGGQRQIGIEVVDSVGNKTVIKVEAKLDFIAPTGPTTPTISDGKFKLSGGKDSESGLKNYRASFYGPVEHHFYESPIDLTKITAIGSYWFGTSADDNAGNNSNVSSYAGTTGSLTVANKTTSYYCSASWLYVNSSKTECYYTSSTTYTCTSRCYYNASGRCSNGAVCNYCHYNISLGTAFCHTNKSTCESLSDSGHTCQSGTYSCSSGVKYGSGSSSYCYHGGYQVYSTTACPSGSTEINGLCYSIS